MDRDVRAVASVFEQRPDGSYAPKHIFGSDFLAIVVAVIAPIAIAAALIGVFALVALVTVPDDDDAVRPTPVVAEAGLR